MLGQFASSGALKRRLVDAHQDGGLTERPFIQAKEILESGKVKV
jgi:hypothetical protein